MCLYTKYMLNRKYLGTKKNGGLPPILLDERVKYVPIACGECIECRKKKARDWSIRLQEEIKHNKNGIFVTLTFNEESLQKYRDKVIQAADGEYIINDNLTAKFAVRDFLERYRKKYKVSCRHWLVTELGHNGTHRIHLHGILFMENRHELEKLWKNGYVFIGDYVNEKTINYIVKYITKIDVDHKDFKSKILCSPGIGNGYLNRYQSKLNKFKKETETKETYVLNNGSSVSLPIYYRNKLYNDEEKEILWINKIDKHIRYVLGSPIDISTSNGLALFNKLQDQARIYNKKMGYGEFNDHDNKIMLKRIREINRNRKP